MKCYCVYTSYPVFPLYCCAAVWWLGSVLVMAVTTEFFLPNAHFLFQILKYSLKPLSLNCKVHAFAPQDADRPRNKVKYTGNFRKRF